MSEEEKKFLEIVDLKKGFGSGQTRQEVLRGMNFSVAKGEFCVLLGPSGSGKSTLLNIIGGIDNADSGYININGDKLEDMSEKKLTQYRRKHLGYVFQMYNLIGNLNVKENIEVGAYLSDNALDIDDLLHTLGLYEHRYKLPNQLSGGQQQRVSIGRAIVKNPDILLCDEPTGALDYNTSKEILKLIEEVNQKYGNTIIMVTHNEAAIGYISLGSLNDTVKALKIGGVEATADNVKSGDYAVSRPFNIAYNGELSDVAQDFVDYIMSSDGQKIVSDNGYVTVSENAAYSGKKPSGKISVAGSSSVSPVMEKLAEAYQKVNTNAKVEIQTSDSSAGMQSAMGGTCDIGMASRDLKDEEKSALKVETIAKDGIAVIVNNANTCDDLTLDQVKSIYTGETTVWSDIIK